MKNGATGLNVIPVERCPICGGASFKIIDKTKTINPNSDLEVAILECTSCSHWFVNPSIKQSDLYLLYTKASEYVVPKGWNAKKTEFSIPEQYIIKTELKRSNKNKKYLEVGIGSGLLFNYFRQIGYNCFGVEPGDWAKGIPNIVQDINELGEDNFDVIVLSDVLEHVEDPLSLVKKISQLMVMEHSNVYASFPNNQSLRALLQRGKWRMVRPFGHLHFFSEKFLRILFETNGFEVIRLSKTDLIKRNTGSMLRSPYFMIKLFLGQSFWGDQWIVHLTKNSNEGSITG